MAQQVRRLVAAKGKHPRRWMGVPLSASILSGEGLAEPPWLSLAFLGFRMRAGKGFATTPLRELPDATVSGFGLDVVVTLDKEDDPFGRWQKAGIPTRRLPRKQPACWNLRVHRRRRGGIKDWGRAQCSG